MRFHAESFTNRGTRTPWRVQWRRRAESREWAKQRAKTHLLHSLWVAPACPLSWLCPWSRQRLTNALSSRLPARRNLRPACGRACRLHPRTEAPSCPPRRRRRHQVISGCSERARQRTRSPRHRAYHSASLKQTKCSAHQVPRRRVGPSPDPRQLHQWCRCRLQDGRVGFCLRWVLRYGRRLKLGKFCRAMFGGCGGIITCGLVFFKSLLSVWESRS